MADGTSSWSAFRNLDSSGEAAANVHWLGVVAELGPIRSGKQRSSELLGAGPGDRVLDVGCGRGDDVLALSRVTGPGGTVGVDSSAVAVEAARSAAREAGVEAEFRVADALELPFADSVFDACRCDRTLQHVEDPHGAVREMVRVVRPGGRLLISEGRGRLVAEPDVDLTQLETLLLLRQAAPERSGWLGFMLPLIFKQAGLSDVQVERLTGELTEAEAIFAYYDLQVLGQRALRSAKLTREEWLEVMSLVHREASSGRLRVVVDTHLFVGTV